VHRRAADLVVGVEQRLGQQRPDVPAAQPIHHPLAVAAALDQPGEAQRGREPMLRWTDRVLSREVDGYGTVTVVVLRDSRLVRLINP
jgi:hypothetical protein